MMEPRPAFKNDKEKKRLNQMKKVETIQPLIEIQVTLKDFAMDANYEKQLKKLDVAIHEKENATKERVIASVPLKELIFEDLGWEMTMRNTPPALVLEGWRKDFDESGKMYFINDNTQTTTYNPPRTRAAIVHYL